MFSKFVILCDHLQFQPLATRKNAWEFMEAVGGNGRSLRVWSGPHKTSKAAMKVFAFCFSREDAARLAFSEKRLSDGIKPQLYAVSALTQSGAIEKVVNQSFMNIGHGAERIG